MKIRILIDDPRLREMVGILVLLLAVGLLLALSSYSPADASANVVTDAERATNWMGIPGAFVADLVLQAFGLTSFLIPTWVALVALIRIRLLPLKHLRRRSAACLLLTIVLCASLEMAGDATQVFVPDRWQSYVRTGGALGTVIAESATDLLNVGGTIILLLTMAIVGVYMLSSRRLINVPRTAPDSPDSRSQGESAGDVDDSPVVADGSGPERQDTSPEAPQLPPLARVVPYRGPEDSTGTFGSVTARIAATDSGTLDEYLSPKKPGYTLPQTALLNPVYSSEPYDEARLQATARQTVSKFEEFGVRGAINRINPGPVVTTFEFKPDRGIKYSKIVNLSEDLCLALECESILVERIPGRPTVGIEVPNKRRETISLREVVDSEVVRQSESLLTFALGKDINGKIHCADLASMPHLLVAGQTGAGKSVMINCVIMSLLLRTNPEQVRLIMVDPKTVELGLYRGIPHLLTPVITDMKEASNALKNAIGEMERRLQLLAQYGARNITQFNDKVEKMQANAKEQTDQSDIGKLPYIVIVVDELADLMMLAGRQVEESIQRLAQMARAVGIHLLLATQRPSVDVITGLIKANIPARISFLVATKVDSRVILDSIGAESLLGKGDMLFLPPGSGSLQRLHGPLVTEDEIEAVVSHWTDIASPEYDTDFLLAPKGRDGRPGKGGHDGFDDAKYKDAVRLVLELGKASTSTLQRRMRLGYGRAARILDAMEEEGIISPPDGSRPRKVLKRPTWIDEGGS